MLTFQWRFLKMEGSKSILYTVEVCMCCITAHRLTPDVHEKTIYPDCFSLCLIDFYQEALSEKREVLAS